MTWQRLVLRDFVIVRELDLDLAPGLTVLTGETGAGKSILIDALQLVLGGRAEATLVREGAPRCEVSAEFGVPPAAASWLREAGFPPDDADTILLRRVVDAQGKSRAWINGSPATATQLRGLADHLVDIHGQHAWQGLVRPETVRQLLDDYGRIDTRPLKQSWQFWRDAVAALDQAREQQTAWQQTRERLEWQLAELDKLGPQVGEWDELNLQHGRLANAQGLMEAAREALVALDGDEVSVQRLIHRARQALDAHRAVEPQYATLVSALDDAAAAVDDVARDLQHRAERAEIDPAELERLDRRLAQWLALARRFRCPPEELPALAVRWRDELRTLQDSADLDRLQAAEGAAHAAVLKAAHAVSAQRRLAAEQLSGAITQAMQQLGMAGGCFEVHLLAQDDVQSYGLEAVEFRVAGHPGATPRPVAKVASGGELSRIALAIAVTTSRLGQAPTLLFDEIDSGIGGAVAHEVGRLMRQLGEDRQVLAVTHLPQVAACAHHHLVVRKSVDPDGVTTSSVCPVESEARVVELARMLGGGEQSTTSLAHARELLDVG